MEANGFDQVDEKHGLERFFLKIEMQGCHLCENTGNKLNALKKNTESKCF